MISGFDFRDVLSIVIGGLCAYWGAYAAFKVEIARLDERLNALKERVDSDRVKLDKCIGGGK